MPPDTTMKGKFASAARAPALVVAVLGVLGARPACALQPDRAITQYGHDQWQTEQGLPQNSVSAIRQTKDGYLWFGTQEGLVRFDGVRLTVFDTTSAPGLLKDAKIAAYTTKEGLSSDQV
jgi:ligand-binding sensor domain-containing protein